MINYLRCLNLIPMPEVHFGEGLSDDVLRDIAIRLTMVERDVCFLKGVVEARDPMTHHR